MIRCVDKQCNDGEPIDGEPAPRFADDGFLCQRHSDTLERRVAELPARRDLLRDCLGGIQGQRSSESKKTKGEPPLPLNIGAHDHLALMHAQVVEWVRLVAEERRETGPATADLRPLASYLVGRHSWVVRQPWVDDYAEEMRDLSRVADGLTAHKARWNRLEAPCPGCGAFELGRWDGQDIAQCASCGQQWQHAALITAQADQHTMTALMAAAWLNVQPSTFRAYVTAGSIAAIGKDSEGLSRYRASDVAGLDQREQTA